MSNTETETRVFRCPTCGERSERPYCDTCKKPILHSVSRLAFLFAVLLTLNSCSLFQSAIDVANIREAQNAANEMNLRYNAQNDAFRKFVNHPKVTMPDDLRDQANATLDSERSVFTNLYTTLNNWFEALRNITKTESETDNG